MTDSPLVGNGRIFLPQVDRIFLRNFSLYDNEPEIEAYFRDGVFCLAGANGLGKSTFLAALNYCVTGIVADPYRKFDSPPEYYRKSQGYSANFFRGRISERDAQLAEVSVDMRVNGRRYQLTRGMFDPIGLRGLVVSRNGTVEAGGPESDLIDDGERHASYVREVVKDSGLQSFAQLVFLHHFVLTFDERRHLLFWDSDVARSALFLAFGADLAQAERADVLRRTSERADSLARNLQWQATDIRKKLAVLEEAAGPEDVDDPELSVQHEAFQRDHDEALAMLTSRESSLSDAELNTANVRAELNAVNAAYDDAVESLFAGVHHPTTHPAVSSSLANARCAVCGTDGPQVTELIQRSLDGNQCPLCNAPLVALSSLDDGLTARLGELDAQRAELTNRIGEEQAAARRLTTEIVSARAALDTLAAKLAEFEKANEALLARSDTSTDGVRAVAERYREQIEDLLSRKDEQRKKRDVARRELRTLEAALTIAYVDAEERFVPLFASLAREFLGLDVDVSFEASAQPPLVLTVQTKQRRNEDALSESQRFFVDIALRMALAIHMTQGGDPACLYIDTPEGSLDIAYERRAGSMFASFVDGGSRMVITANINTSQLLLRLAEACGTAKMELRRMTDWTSLSDVQAAEEDLFDKAYAAIEAAMVGETA